MKNVAIKSVGHAAILTAFETFHYDVRSVPRGSELPQRKPGGFTRNLLLVDVFDPREIRQMALPTCQKEAHWQSCGRIEPWTTLMHVASAIGSPSILHEFEVTRINGG